MNNKWVKKEIKREIKKYHEEKQKWKHNIVNFGDAAKVVPSGKFATTIANFEKFENCKLRKSKIINRKAKLTSQETKKGRKS